MKTIASQIWDNMTRNEQIHCNAIYYGLDSHWIFASADLSPLQLAQVMQDDDICPMNQLAIDLSPPFFQVQ